MKKEFYYLIAATAYMLLEYWLGKTKRFKSNSLLELLMVAGAFAAIFIYLTGRGLWLKKQELQK